MIKLEHLSKTFHKGLSNESLAVRDVSLQIQQGEYLIIVGSNGSGKSTLLNLIAGNIFPDNGNIHINTTDVTTWKDYQRSKFISRVFQNPLQGTAPDLSVLDNFRLAALRTQHKKLISGINKNFEQLVKEHINVLRLGLENKLHQPMGTLSGGQRQALTLVMGTMDNCKLMLLDEPAAALDPRSAALVMEKANDIIIINKLTAILVTHNMKDALQYGNRLIQMKEGVVIRDLNGEQKNKLMQEELYRWFD